MKDYWIHTQEVFEQNHGFQQCMNKYSNSTAQKTKDVLVNLAGMFYVVSGWDHDLPSPGMMHDAGVFH